MLRFTFRTHRGAACLPSLYHSRVLPALQNSEGQVIGARCKDKVNGEEVDVYARLVVNATGPYLDNVRRLSDPQ